MTKQDRHVCVVTFGLNETGILAAADKPLNAALCFSMKKNHHLIVLTKYQNLMAPHERILARWLTEEWDGEGTELPSWLLNKIWNKYPSNCLNDPSALARKLFLKIMENNRSEISLRE
ncbi:hypothetical protein [Alteromonas sp. S005]|uniref:hypothetical protein n=1 Tax=Alteromonas sp. S005 TaxID=3117400 RepID=UPI002FE34816